MLNYSAINQAVFNEIPTFAKSVLDIGCGTGVFGKSLKEKMSVEINVTGITFSESEAKEASNHLDKVIVHNLNIPIEIQDTFDCIVCSHVLEHLYRPDMLLESLKKNMTDQSVLVVALPNVLFYQQRLKFVAGQFRYSENGGLMDVTHYRFFDWNTSEELLTSCGFQVTKKFATGNFPLSILRNKLGNLSSKIDKKAIRLFPGLFGFQFIMVAKKS
jgi:SAM-dependent methyltransferase